MDIMSWLLCAFGAFLLFIMSAIIIDLRFLAPRRRAKDKAVWARQEEEYERMEAIREKVRENERIQESVGQSAKDYDELMEAERIMDELNGIIAKPVQNKNEKKPRKKKPPKSLSRLAHKYDEIMRAEDIMEELERENAERKNRTV